MKLSRTEYATLALILATLVVGVVVYPHLPEQMASHWNIRGEVDGYFGKFWGTFFLPLVNMGVWLMLILVPRIDPLKENIARFRRYYDLLVSALIVFFTYLHVLTIVWNLGVEFNLLQFLAPVLALLIYLVGVLIGHSRRNYMVGIRTPWTLASDTVWQKTHRVGSLLFKLSGIIILLAVFFPGWLVLLLLIPLLGSTVYLFVYSYIEYRKLERAG